MCFGRVLTDEGTLYEETYRSHTGRFVLRVLAVITVEARPLHAQVNVLRAGDVICSSRPLKARGRRGGW